VLGNFGAPELSEIIAPQLASKDPMIRATALSTLRFVETQAAETILVEAMTKDEDGEVRRAAAQELTFRRLDTASLAAVRELARTAREERLASALLTVLHAHIAVDPTLRQDIERLARNHPAEPIRQQAAALLTTI
jgi:HEAT repeat protein